jgi:hypothetical protein
MVTEDGIGAAIQPDNPVEDRLHIERASHQLGGEVGYQMSVSIVRCDPSGSV